MVSDTRDLAVIYLKGFCMGMADAVPGVSGGTIALITGIYERLIAAITAIEPDRIRRVLSGVRPRDRGTAWEALLEMDAFFLAALGVGVVTAVVAVTGAVEYAVHAYPVPTFGFFLGLIAASALVLADAVSLDTPGRVVAALFGFALAFVVSGEAAAGLGHSLPVVFFAGSIAVSAMILPGVSGSLILFILGQYTYMTETLSRVREGVVGLAGGGDIAAVFDPSVVAAVFIAGAVVGLFTVSHAVRYALEHARRATLAFLVALIVGALRAPLLRIDRALAETGRGWTPDVLAVVLGTALVGGAVVVLIERYLGGVDY